MAVNPVVRYSKRSCFAPARVVLAPKTPAKWVSDFARTTPDMSCHLMSLTTASKRAFESPVRLIRSETKCFWTCTWIGFASATDFGFEMHVGTKGRQRGACRACRLLFLRLNTLVQSYQNRHRRRCCGLREKQRRGRTFVLSTAPPP